MAFHTFKHPDFASKYRLFRVITQDQAKPPKADFVPAETFATERELRLVFRMTDTDWAEAKELLAKRGYFVFCWGGLLPDLPD